MRDNEMLAEAFSRQLGGTKEDYLEGLDATDEAINNGTMKTVLILEDEEQADLPFC